MFFQSEPKRTTYVFEDKSGLVDVRMTEQNDDMKDLKKDTVNLSINLIFYQKIILKLRWSNSSVYCSYKFRIWKSDIRITCWTIKDV